MIAKLKNENIALKIQMSELILEKKQIEKELKVNRRLANFDFLTKLSNRSSFTRSLEELLEDLKDLNYTFGVIYIDLDNFKKVNDTYSHMHGDHVLKEIAKLLILENRANSVIGRLGGEEFAIIIPGAKTIEQIAKAAERIRLAIEELVLEGIDIDVTASIGVYKPVKTDTSEDIIYKADKAMYHSKKTGKNKVTLYSENI